MIDDEGEVLDLIEQILREEGLSVKRFSRAEELLDSLPEESFDVIISDLILPGLSGLELLDMLHSMNIETPFVLITGYASLDTAIQAVNRGAFYYIKKPFTIEEIRLVVSRLRQRQDLLEEVLSLKQQVSRLQAMLDGKTEKDLGEAAPEIPRMASGGGYDINKLADTIKHLGSLRAEGIISDEEFGEYKGRLLKRIV
ncbi:MAG TPA: response regulator [Deltaproteobacteria bacterium]|nr:response regulator [Deltaproteobacteria bacterium]